MDTITEHMESQEAQVDLSKLTPEQVDFMINTMIREGFLQEADRSNMDRVRSRWVLRTKDKQVSAKDLKQRGD
jgi:hypothetical protein